MKTIIISLGGSIIVPDKIDHEYLREFRDFVKGLRSKDYRIIIIAGGGRPAREYQEALSNIGETNSEKLDWIGIEATKLNAHLLLHIFGDEVYPRIIDDPTMPLKTEKKIIIGSGWKPGCSTDYDAVLLSKNLGSDLIINLSNIKSVYDKDPAKFKDAKPIKHIGWQAFRKIVGEEWLPGLNMPFDPIASKEAQKSELKVAILYGKDIENIKKFLDQKDFIGTLIRD